MAQPYQQYGGNPYGRHEPNQPQANFNTNAGYNGSNPYGQNEPYQQQANLNTNYGNDGRNPYGSNYNEPLQPPATLTHADSNYSQPSQYSQQGAGLFTSPNTNTSIPPTSAPSEQPGRQPLTKNEFLERINGTKTRIGTLSADIQSIGQIHQRMLSSPDGGSSGELESLVTKTQVLNTGIKDEIKFLERDAARDPHNSMKTTQIKALKGQFWTQLKDFEKQEIEYSQRYRSAIGRQYKIVNPDATPAEVEEAANADWGNEGVFTTALKSNRSGQASSVLGAVRARHNDIQRIEKTMSELALLFTQLNETVVYQEPQIEAAEAQTTQVKEDTEAANVQLKKAEDHARRARKLKWYVLLVVVLIVLIIALALGLYFGLQKKNNK